MKIPCSPLNSVNDLIYFPRMCDEIRLHAAGEPHEDYTRNLGVGMDLWTCQFWGITYEGLVTKITAGASDKEALPWTHEADLSRPDYESNWWKFYMLNRGFRDDLSERLEQRKVEAGFADRDDIKSFMDYIIADEKI